MRETRWSFGWNFWLQGKQNQSNNFECFCSWNLGTVGILHRRIWSAKDWEIASYLNVGYGPHRKFPFKLDSALTCMWGCVCEDTIRSWCPITLGV